MANLNLRISEVAREHGMTIAQIAESMGVKAQSLSQDIYRGSFSLDKLGKIADILGVEVPELFEAYKTPSSASIGATTVCPHCGNNIGITLIIGK